MEADDRTVMARRVQGGRNFFPSRRSRDLTSIEHGPDSNTWLCNLTGKVRSTLTVFGT